MMITTKQATEQIKIMQAEAKSTERTPEELKKIKDFQKGLRSKKEKIDKENPSKSDAPVENSNPKEITQERLIELSKLRPLYRDLEIDELAEQTETKASSIKAEVNLIIKERKEADKELKTIESNDKKTKDKLDKEIAKEQEEQRKKDFAIANAEMIKGDIKLEVAQFIATKKDDDATELISERIQEENYFYSTSNDLKSELYYYDNGIYRPNGKSYIRELCRLFLGKSHTSQRANKVIDKIEEDNKINEKEFFDKQFENLEELPTLDGILNITTREITPFTPKKVFFNKLPINYNPKAECPAIDKFFKEILKSEDDAKVMYQLFGFALLKEYRFEKAFMFVGNGRNGKGKTLSLMKRFVGGENCSAIPLSDMDTNSTSLCEMIGKLLNIAGDLSATALKNTGKFKELSGRDLVSAKRKFLSDLPFINYAKMVFACNELPRVYDFSVGFWSRWILLEFPYEFVKQDIYNTKEDKTNLKIEDPLIIDKISTPEELNGLLIKALDGLDALKKQGGFSYTTGTGEVKEFWVRKSDSFTAFCMDSIEEDPEEFIEKGVLRKKFHKYCKEHKLKSASDKSIKVTLESMFGSIDVRKGSFDNLIRVWDGIKFKEEEEKGNNAKGDLWNQ